jgi:hypothetical protein
MRDEERINPGHSEIRLIARVLGPSMIAVGVVFTAIALISFFSAMNGGGMPKYFWCGFVGLPLIGLGTGVTQFAYLGLFARYIAGETAPVQKDTFNYVAQGIRPGVKDLLQAVREGLTEESPEGPAGDKKFCSNCGQAATLDANFCSGCGQKL